MTRALLASLVLSFAVSSAVAQPPPDGPRGRGPRGGAGWYDRMLARVTNELQLDESQREQFDEIVATHRERMQEMGQRWQELRQAMRDGDEERAAVLRAELPQRGPGGMFGPILEDLEPLLREDQLERLHAMQERMQEGRRRGDMYRRVMTELPEELGLDEAQREQWDQLMATRREQRREQFEQMRPIWEEMRTAQEAGDEERLAELRAQLEEMRADPEAGLQSLFDELEGILREDQILILNEYRRELGTRARGDADEPGDLRNILRAAKRVRLDSEQREALREIESEAGNARREIDRRDAEAARRLAAKVKQQIIEILDPDQQREFEENLSRLDRDVRRSREGRPREGRAREDGRSPRRP